MTATLAGITDSRQMVWDKIFTLKIMENSKIKFLKNKFKMEIIFKIFKNIRQLKTSS
jgi:hypothetical protein